jgi:2-keto-4-pentenoate hydratase
VRAVAVTVSPVTAVDPRVASAVAIQLAEWRRALADGAERVGWKLGMGERERIRDEIAVGHLTSATVLEDGALYVAHVDSLHADVELAVELGADGNRYAVALELVDLASPPDNPEDVVAENIFHRAVLFGTWHPRLPREAAARLEINGELRATDKAPADADERLTRASRVLQAAGEELRAGDRVITGSIVQLPVFAGDELTAALDGLGAVRVTVAR